MGEKSEWDQRFLLAEGRYYQRAKNYDRALKAFRDVVKRRGTAAGEGAYYAAETLWQQNAAAPSEEGAARALEALGALCRTTPIALRAPTPICVWPTISSPFTTTCRPPVPTNA